nr:MAG TPA: hypothetical protein [Caudoviricetes sp.]
MGFKIPRLSRRASSSLASGTILYSNHIIKTLFNS